MRKILTSALFVLEKQHRYILGRIITNQDFVETNLRKILTRRRKIFTDPWIFQTIFFLFFAHKSRKAYARRRNRTLLHLFAGKIEHFKPPEIRVFQTKHTVG